MFIFKKSNHSKILKVYEEDMEIDQIHYENITHLAYILEKYYAKELMYPDKY